MPKNLRKWKNWKLMTYNMTWIRPPWKLQKKSSPGKQQTENAHLETDKQISPGKWHYENVQHG